jgi:hypothetical protein
MLGTCGREGDIINSTETESTDIEKISERKRKWKKKK